MVATSSSKRFSLRSFASHSDLNSIHFPVPSSLFPAEQISWKETLNLDPIGFPRLGSLLWELIYSRENWVLNSTSNK
ncbi:hypothetical protein V6N11_017379 [Hibiscus sabdariffa]|uniref:Uncharacterized protein n=1 Tax=Hibiscus sabdariffa TaxID=183260 RepID=A0ABR2TY52_9ROSI